MTSDNDKSLRQEVRAKKVKLWLANCKNNEARFCEQMLQQARAEVIEQVKNIIEPYIRDSVLPQVLEELNKLERGAE